MKEKVNVTGVPETMVQTLYARAKETRKKNAKINDEIAVELVKKLDYDFSKADKDNAMTYGVIARTIVLDRCILMGFFFVSSSNALCYLYLSSHSRHRS